MIHPLPVCLLLFLIIRPDYRFIAPPVASHIGVDDPEWGRYESMLRAALIVIKQHYYRSFHEVAIDAVLKGDV